MNKAIYFLSLKLAFKIHTALNCILLNDIHKEIISNITLVNQDEPHAKKVKI